MKSVYARSFGGGGTRRRVAYSVGDGNSIETYVCERVVKIDLDQMIPLLRTGVLVTSAQDVRFVNRGPVVVRQRARALASCGSVNDDCYRNARR